MAGESNRFGGSPARHDGGPDWANLGHPLRFLVTASQQNRAADERENRGSPGQQFCNQSVRLVRTRNMSTRLVHFGYVSPLDEPITVLNGHKTGPTAERVPKLLAMSTIPAAHSPHFQNQRKHHLVERYNVGISPAIACIARKCWVHDPRQPEHLQAQERPLAQASPQNAFPLHAHTAGRDLVFDPERKVLARASFVSVENSTTTAML